MGDLCASDFDWRDGAKGLGNFGVGVVNAATGSDFCGWEGAGQSWSRNIGSATFFIETALYTGGQIAANRAALRALIADEAGAASFGARFSSDQSALIQLAKEAKRLGGLSPDDARVLLQWADELGLRSHGIMTHGGRAGFGGTVPHININPVRHIPILMP